MCNTTLAYSFDSATGIIINVSLWNSSNLRNIHVASVIVTVIQYADSTADKNNTKCNISTRDIGRSIMLFYERKEDEIF